MTGLFIVLFGIGIGYYLYSQKLTKETTLPELKPTGEIKYPSSMTPLTTKTEVTYDSTTNQIRIQPKPIQKKDITFVPNPITIDINKIIDKLTRKLQPQPQQSQSQPAPKLQLQQVQSQPTKEIKQILQETLNRLEI